MFTIDNRRVRTLLLATGLSMAAFAQKANLNVLTVKRTLKDGATASIRTISALAKVFGVNADSLILSSNEVKS